MGELRIGTRRSRLAMIQSELIAGALQAVDPTLRVRLAPIDTRGDRTPGPLAAVGGKGLFTLELEQQLRDGQIDLAVHSAKDVPFEMEEAFIAAAVFERSDPRDALVSRHGTLDDLPPHATVGTGSPRRRAQLLRARPDLRIEPVRGNVTTRFDRALGEQADLDAVVLAVAGLDRLGLLDSARQSITPLTIDQCVPAAGQGSLMIQTLADRHDLIERLRAINHVPSAASLRAERAVLRHLQADCHSCVAVYVSPEPEAWVGQCFVARPDGSDAARLAVRADDADAVARTLIDRLDGLNVCIR